MYSKLRINAMLCNMHNKPTILILVTGLPQIQDFEIPDFFKTFSGPEIIFFKTANDRNFIRVYQKI